ncbi:hypothetical protein DPMN_103518 [Dreissena polymorpha]|uniref:EB domain-containing protein n=1 Tax=Dreissena polymorpha TaxID=45954 RepID=A0A9D4H8L4_DREPO|nr:hypothetical protein DPMN_103518 [Dreissena polymorpha]
MSTSKVCECAENKECEIDTCREKQCRCVLGYAESPDGKTCNKLATLGETCSNQTICQGFNTRCTDSGVCDCADGFERSDNGRWCRLQSKFGIDFPLLGEKCNGGFFQDCYMFFEQTCIQGKCRCKGSLRDASPEDINATFPDEIQCVEESFKQGHRKPQPCTNGTGRRSPIDTKMAYERAKSKIKRIQDIIIGSCVGSVALLGIIIGIVALIRWKRRGRENFMDTSSTASTDGQASRYM